MNEQTTKGEIDLCLHPPKDVTACVHFFFLFFLFSKGHIETENERRTDGCCHQK